MLLSTFIYKFLLGHNVLVGSHLEMEMLVVQYLRNYCLIQGNLYFHMSFIVLAHTFVLWPILSYFLYMVWDRRPTSFHSMCITGCPNTVCWKDYYFTIEWSWHPCQKLTIDVRGGLIFPWIFSSIPFICVSLNANSTLSSLL